eukprot:m.363884 g.363884  ORF g.363884 m.363884 type:complete len:106 (-) comp24569_c0_seq1:547-864(-)
MQRRSPDVQIKTVVYPFVDKTHKTVDLEFERNLVEFLAPSLAPDVTSAGYQAMNDKTMHKVAQFRQRFKSLLDGVSDLDVQRAKAEGMASEACSIVASHMKGNQL